MNSDNSEERNIKYLRALRKERISLNSKRLAIQNKNLKKIKESLSDSDKTVPQIAEDTGIPAHEVLYFIATMKKYGEILEGAKDGVYFHYILSERLQAAGESA